MSFRKAAGGLVQNAGGLETKMGLIVEFPAVLTRRITPALPLPADGAQVVILPVVRIERHDETPSDGHDGGEGTKSRGRRRRARS